MRELRSSQRKAAEITQPDRVSNDRGRTTRNSIAAAQTTEALDSLINQSAESQYTIKDLTEDQSTKEARLNAELLVQDSEYILSCGVDWGTVTSSATWLKVRTNDLHNIDFVERIGTLRTHGNDFRFPTLAAIQPNATNPREGRLVFARTVTRAMRDGFITAEDIISFPKFGLIKSYEGIFETDRETIANVHERQTRTLNRIAQRHSTVKTAIPGSDHAREISVKNIDDIIVAYLSYFLGIFKRGLAEKLHFTSQEVDTVFKLDKIEVGFAGQRSGVTQCSILS